jgi:hypothetical protein
MKNPVWLLKWILKAAIFFTLFAFALNNQHEASVHFFFGNQWRSPMVLIVLAAFAIGIIVGVLGMAPWWWRHRNATSRERLPASTPDAVPDSPAKPPATTGATHGI